MLHTYILVILSGCNKIVVDATLMYCTKINELGVKKLTTFYSLESFDTIESFWCLGRSWVDESNNKKFGNGERGQHRHNQGRGQNGQRSLNK